MFPRHLPEKRTPVLFREEWVSFLCATFWDAEIPSRSKKNGTKKTISLTWQPPSLEGGGFSGGIPWKTSRVAERKKNERKNYSTADIQELTVDLPRVGPTCQQKWDSPIFFDRNETRGWKITMMPPRHCHREVGSRFSLYKSISINSLWKIVGLSLWAFFPLFLAVREGIWKNGGNFFFRACVLHLRRIGFH